MSYVIPVWVAPVTARAIPCPVHVLWCVVWGFFGGYPGRAAQLEVTVPAPKPEPEEPFEAEEAVGAASLLTLAGVAIVPSGACGAAPHAAAAVQVPVGPGTGRRGPSLSPGPCAVHADDRRNARPGSAAGDSAPQLPSPRPHRGGQAAATASTTALLLCPSCDFTTSRRWNMDKHRELHDANPGADLVPCPHPGCGRRYLSRKALYAHIDDTHDGVRAPVGVPEAPGGLLHCAQCDYVTSDRSRMKKHDARHAARPRAPLVLCPVEGCGKRFMRRQVGFSLIRVSWMSAEPVVVVGGRA
jgi:hypothetical protein